MKDIETRDDLEIFTREFYNSLLSDTSINYIFTEVMNINLEQHLPVITDFWEQTLFHTGNYRNNTMAIHLKINDIEPVTKRHFEIWLHHFYIVADRLYSGRQTEKMKTKALSIATVMKIKISSI